MTEEEALQNVSGSALVGIIDRDAVQSGKGIKHKMHSISDSVSRGVL